MTLLAPAWLWTAGALVIVALLHFMQSRWKRRVVGSLILWKRVAARGLEIHARRPTLDLALLLGLVGAAMLVLAAAGPMLVTAARPGREMVVVLDNGTASLTKGADDSSRLEKAIALARAELASLEDGSRAAVVATSPSPHVIMPMGDPARALAALRGKVRSCQVTGSLPAAVSLALAQGSAEAETAVYTSRTLPPSPANVRRVAVGSESANVGVIHADFSNSHAFVAVRSFAARPVDLRVALRSVEPGPRELAAETVRLAPLGRADVVLVPVGDAASGLAAARAVAVEVSTPGDDLDADNVVFATRSSRGARVVGTVGDPGEALLRALWAARVETVTLAEEGAPETIPEDVDALVYTSTTPASWPPPLPALIVAPGGSVGPIEVLDDELRDVGGMFAGTDARTSPTRGFPPKEIAVRRSTRVRILGGAERLLESNGEILAARVAGGGGPHFYLGFRPDDSDWPERASFPVFVSRVFGELGSRARGGGTLDFARVGDVAARHLAPGVMAARFPGGTDVPRSARLFEAGLYRAGDAPLAVGLVSETESDNRLAPPSAPSAEADTTPRPRPVSVTSWGFAGALAAVALALLAAEWLVSSRRS